MKPYHPGNLKLVPYAGWRIIALAWAGKLLGITFQVHGVPFGSSKPRPMVGPLCGDGGTVFSVGMSENGIG